MPDNSVAKMAYLTCPDCLMPAPVADDAANYTCFTCCAVVVFECCHECLFSQSISSRWLRAFTCATCGGKVVIPHRRAYAPLARRRDDKGTATTYRIIKYKYV